MMSPKVTSTPIGRRIVPNSAINPTEQPPYSSSFAMPSGGAGASENVTPSSASVFAIFSTSFAMSVSSTRMPTIVASMSIVVRCATPRIAHISVPPFKARFPAYGDLSIRARKRSAKKLWSASWGETPFAFAQLLMRARSDMDSAEFTAMPPSRDGPCLRCPSSARSRTIWTDSAPAISRNCAERRRTSPRRSSSRIL